MLDSLEMIPRATEGEPDLDEKTSAAEASLDDATFWAEIETLAAGGAPSIYFSSEELYG